MRSGGYVVVVEHSPTSDRRRRDDPPASDDLHLIGWRRECLRSDRLRRSRVVNNGLMGSSRARHLNQDVPPGVIKRRLQRDGGSWAPWDAIEGKHTPAEGTRP